MQKTKRPILIALFLIAALLLAVGGFLFSRLNPSQRILQAIEATAHQNTQRQEAIQRNYPVFSRLDALTAGSGTLECQVTFSQVENVPFAPLVGAFLGQTGAWINVKNDVSAKTADVSMQLTLPGAAQVRSNVYTSPELVCLALPDFTEMVVSAPPEQFGMQLANALPVGELGTLFALGLARPDGQTMNRLSEPLLAIGGHLLAKAKFSAPQQDVIRIEIDGDAGKNAILSLVTLLEQERAMSSDATSTLRTFCEENDSISLFAELIIPGETINSARITATAWKDGASAGAVELAYENKNAGESQILTLSPTDREGNTTRLTLGTLVSNRETAGRLDYSLAVEQGDGKSSTLTLTLAANSADNLDCFADLSVDGKSVSLYAVGGSLTQDQDRLRFDIPSLRIKAAALQKAELIYRLALTREPFAGGLSAPEAVPLDSMSAEERQALFTAYQDGLRRTLGNMLGGMILG